MENKATLKNKFQESIEKEILYEKNSVQCKYCGHKILFSRRSKEICNICGHYVFKNKKEEFKFRLRGKL